MIDSRDVLKDNVEVEEVEVGMHGLRQVEMDLNRDGLGDYGSWLCRATNDVLVVMNSGLAGMDQL